MAISPTVSRYYPHDLDPRTGTAPKAGRVNGEAHREHEGYLWKSFWDPKRDKLRHVNSGSALRTKRERLYILVSVVPRSVSPLTLPSTGQCWVSLF